MGALVAQARHAASGEVLRDVALRAAADVATDAAGGQDNVAPARSDRAPRRVGVPLALPEQAHVRLTIEVETQPALSDLGQRLTALREDVIRSGVPLLDWSGLEAEVASRRGGWHEDV